MPEEKNDMWGNLGSELSPIITIVSAILIVAVLIIALSLRGKIKRTERGNEFLFWGKQLEDAQINEMQNDLEEEDEENEEDEEDETE